MAQRGFQKTARAAVFLAACALTMDDEVKCWGANGARQLGSEIIGSNVPVAVAL